MYFFISPSLQHDLPETVSVIALKANVIQVLLHAAELIPANYIQINVRKTLPDIQLRPQSPQEHSLHEDLNDDFRGGKRGNAGQSQSRYKGRRRRISGIQYGGIR